MKAALYYNNINDKEALYCQKLKEKSKDSELLEKFSCIDKLDPLNRFITQQDIKLFIK